MRCMCVCVYDMRVLVNSVLFGFNTCHIRANYGNGLFVRIMEMQTIDEQTDFFFLPYTYFAM